MHVELNLVKFLNLIVQLYNQMVFSELVLVVGLLLATCALLFSSSLGIFGMDQELSSVKYLPESTQILTTK